MQWRWLNKIYLSWKAFSVKAMHFCNMNADFTIQSILTGEKHDHLFEMRSMNKHLNSIFWATGSTLQLKQQKTINFRLLLELTQLTYKHFYVFTKKGLCILWYIPVFFFRSSFSFSLPWKWLCMQLHNRRRMNCLKGVLVNHNIQLLCMWSIHSRVLYIQWQHENSLRYTL